MKLGGGLEGGRGAVTQTARLSGLSLHGPTGLGCSLATVTHGWGEGVGGFGESRFREDSLRTSEKCSPADKGNTEHCLSANQSDGL